MKKLELLKDGLFFDIGM